MRETMDNLFIDIERFVRFTYANPQLFHEAGTYCNCDDLGTNNTAKSWRRYEKLSKDSVEKVNEKYLGEEQIFRVINIADFILCINMEKDHNRGNTGHAISSTGKKVLMMLLLGRVLEEDFRESALVVKKDTDDSLYKYLSSFGGNQDRYYYYPGRTISVKQLDNMVTRYRNRITMLGIMAGLDELEKRGFVEKVVVKDLNITEMDGLYKLNFAMCYKFFSESIV